MLLLQLGIDRGLGLLQLGHVAHFSSGQIVVEVELEFLHRDFSLEHRVGQRFGKVLDPLVGGESLGLDLVLVGLLVEGETVSGDGGVDSGAILGVVFDDVS